ncbi:MAG: right-handed parallel beta-helix repeat-containing protein [Actinobacteria bacterium]|nr:right-handed parallel beta-helix repeat-containing protein [Actinomycetota bacterium]
MVRFHPRELLALPLPLLVLAMLVFSLTAASPAAAAPSALPPVDSPYAIGRPVLKTIWVDPRSGSDGRSGASRRQALRTLDAAWQRIPQGRALTRTGYRIMITPGSLAPTAVPNYFESRYGTARFPILIQSADGAGSVTLPAVNIFDTRYLYLVGLTFSSRLGDAVHCEKCDHFLLRGSTVRGAPRDSGDIGDLVKINQSQYVFLESNDISGASDNAGSAYLRVSGNEFYDCGTGGFTAGQGTGFQFMSVPWLQYEAYGITITNNVVHDAEGAGFGVNGGYNVLIAYNTMYRIGTRDHLLEFVAGHRSCDGVPGDEGRDRCSAYLARGGWGTRKRLDADHGRCSLLRLVAERLERRRADAIRR